MIELLGLFAFVAVGVFLVGAVAVGFVMLKLVVWLLFLPFRVLGWLLFLPFLLLKGLFGVLIRDFRFACPGWLRYTSESRRAHEILFVAPSSSSRGRHLSPR